MKKLFIFMLTALITFTSVYQLPVFANTNSTDISTKYTYYDDGSYMLEYIIDESNSGITRSSSTTTKSKIASYYSSSNVELWYVKSLVHLHMMEHHLSAPIQVSVQLHMTKTGK